MQETDNATDQQQEQGNDNRNVNGNKNVNNNNSKVATKQQVKAINQKLQEISLLVGKGEEDIIHMLRTRVGEFKAIDNLTEKQAKLAIENLTKWKISAENRIQ